MFSLRNYSSSKYDEAHAQQLVETTWAMTKSMLLGVVVFIALLLGMGEPFNPWILAVFLQASFGVWALYRKEWYILARYYVFFGAVLGCLMVLSNFGLSSYAYLLFAPLVLATLCCFQKPIERFGLSILALFLAFVVVKLELTVSIIDSYASAEEFRILFVLLTLMLSYDMTGSFLRVNRDFRKRSKRMVETLQSEELQLQLECEKVEIQARELMVTNRKLETEIKNGIQVERRLSASNDQLSQFSFAASHDLKEPLRSISSFIQLIQKKVNCVEDAIIEEHTTAVIESSSRMTNLLNDLLVYSRAGKFGLTSTVIDLNKVVEGCLYKYESKIKACDAQVVLHELPFIMADKASVEMLFDQLIDNTIRFRDVSRKLNVSIASGGICDGMVEIRLTDNGIGIEENMRKKVFQLFQKKEINCNKKGAGIGLAISKKIIHSFGGDIKFVSNEGVHGITCAFTFPHIPKNTF